MRAHLIAPVFAAMLALPLAAAAQTSPCEGRTCVEQKWEALRQRAIEQLQRDEPTRTMSVPADLRTPEANRERHRATAQSSIIASVDPVEADDSTAAATVRRLAGAIKTNPEGTEAGIVIAPFALAGSDVLPGLELTFAALEGDFTRTGVSYTKDASPKLADVWKAPAACPIPPRIKKLERPHEFYLTACTAVVAAVPETVGETSGLSEPERAAYATRMAQARLACGLTRDPASTAASTMPEAIALVRRAVEIVNSVGALTDAIIPRNVLGISLGLAPTATALTNWTLASSTSCYSGDDIQGYFRQLYWRAGTWKLAGSVSFDLFPRKYGFSPDDSTLPNGDVRSGEARLDFSHTREATEFSAGVAFGRSRDELGDELRGYVGPSASIARAFSLLPKKRPLRTTEGELNVVDGELPPRLVLGFSTAIEVAVNKRASQDTRFNKVKIQPHLDFLINETLSFRLGVPIRGEIAVRKAEEAVEATPTTPAKPAVVEKRALQWTLPVAIIAVIKM